MRWENQVIIRGKEFDTIWFVVTGFSVSSMLTLFSCKFCFTFLVKSQTISCELIMLIFDVELEPIFYQFLFHL